MAMPRPRPFRSGVNGGIGAGGGAAGFKQYVGDGFRRKHRPCRGPHARWCRCASCGSERSNFVCHDSFLISSWGVKINFAPNDNLLGTVCFQPAGEPASCLPDFTLRQPLPRHCADWRKCDGFHSGGRTALGIIESAGWSHNRNISWTAALWL